MKHVRRLLVAVALAMGVAACGGGDTASEPATEAAQTAEEAVTPAAEAGGTGSVGTADSALGTILVDGEGRTLYRFLNDSEGSSSCTDDCLANWPLLPGGEGTAVAAGADPSLLGSIDRPEGTQATYADWPLYYFAGDTAPGETNGQGVGDVWYVVAPDGALIEAAG